MVPGWSPLTSTRGRGGRGRANVLVRHVDAPALTVTVESSAVSTQIDADVWRTYLIRGPRASGDGGRPTVLPGGGPNCTVRAGKESRRVKPGNFTARAERRKYGRVNARPAGGSACAQERVVGPRGPRRARL